jgi:hypothetical protein
MLNRYPGLHRRNGVDIIEQRCLRRRLHARCRGDGAQRRVPKQSGNVPLHIQYP